MTMTHIPNGNGPTPAPFSSTTTPLYVQVQGWLHERIASGDFKHAIPNENDLARQVGVSSGTMRKALDALEERGLIERKQGRGTFVREAETWNEIQEKCAAFLAIFSARLRPTDRPAAQALVAVDKKGQPLMEEHDGGSRPITHTARELRILSEQSAALAAWLERRAMLGRQEAA